MTYAGIDFSMTCPAITIGNSKDFKNCKSFYYSSSKKLEGKYGNIYGVLHLPYENEMERFDNVTEWAIAILTKFKVYEVCLEGYAMGAKGRVFNIAENTGILKYKMWKNNIAFHTPSPPSVKKHFSGKGNANKEEMYEAFYTKTSVDIPSILGVKAKDNPVSDVVDSYAMLEYGIDNHFK